MCIAYQGGSKTGNWNKGSFDSAEDSLKRHFNKHGKEVDGVIRYKKNGKYIDLAPYGSIISYGKQ